MDRSRLLVWTAVAVICAVPVLSGPVVGVVDLTREPLDGIGDGSATIDAVEAPDTALFDRALSSDSYVLKVPDARIHVASIEGRPLVSYKLSIPAMSYSRATTHFLSPDDTGWVDISLARETFAPDRIDQSTYEANLSLILRVNDTKQTLHDEPITLEVTG